MFVTLVNEKTGTRHVAIVTRELEHGKVDLIVFYPEFSSTGTVKNGVPWKNHVATDKDGNPAFDYVVSGSPFTEPAAEFYEEDL